MSEANAVARLCPKCGSGKTKVQGEGLQGHLEGAPATAWCMACGWSGNRQDLLVCGIPAQPGLNPDQCLQIAQAVSDNYLRRLAFNAAQPIGLSMIEAGVIGRMEQEVLGRLIRAAVTGAHNATLREIEVIQKELSSGS